MKAESWSKSRIKMKRAEHRAGEWKISQRVPVVFRFPCQEIKEVQRVSLKDGECRLPI